MGDRRHGAETKCGRPTKRSSCRDGVSRTTFEPYISVRRAMWRCPTSSERSLAMLIGVPKEVKTHEYRVGLTPGSVRELAHHGHKAIVETGAGVDIGFDDASYEAVGATIVPSAADVFAAAETIVKVKEPQPEEVSALREGQVLFTYLHLAADKPLTEDLVRSGLTAIAYETVTDARGGLPLLAPMSEVAGRMAVQVEPTASRRSRAASACCSAVYPVSRQQ